MRELYKRLCSMLMLTKEYFTENREKICHENLINMILISGVGIIITAILLIIAPIIIPSWTMTWEYYCLIPIQFIYLLFALLCRYKSSAV